MVTCPRRCLLCYYKLRQLHKHHRLPERVCTQLWSPEGLWWDLVYCEMSPRVLRPPRRDGSPPASLSNEAGTGTPHTEPHAYSPAHHALCNLGGCCSGVTRCRHRASSAPASHEFSSSSAPFLPHQCPAAAQPLQLCGPLLSPVPCRWGCTWLLKGYTAMAPEWYCSNHKRACTKRRNFPIFPIKDFSLGTFCSLCPRTDGSASSVPGLQIQPKAPVHPRPRACCMHQPHVEHPEPPHL